VTDAALVRIELDACSHAPVPEGGVITPPEAPAGEQAAAYGRVVVPGAQEVAVRNRSQT
jgi:hypothetical protein